MTSSDDVGVRVHPPFLLDMEMFMTFGLAAIVRRKEKGRFGRRNWVERFYLLKAIFIWAAVGILYHDLLKLSFFPLLSRFPLIRGTNGFARVGRNARVFGSLEIVFDDRCCRGDLEIGEHFNSQNNVTLAPRGGTIRIGHNGFVGSGTLIQATSGSFVSI